MILLYKELIKNYKSNYKIKNKLKKQVNKMATNFSEDISSREDSLKVFMNYFKGKNDVYIIIFFLEEATSPVFFI